MSKYELVNTEMTVVKDQIRECRWAFHDDAFRDLLRGLKGVIWEHEIRLDGIRVATSENTGFSDTTNRAGNGRWRNR
jgi:hypothetical protein